MVEQLGLAIILSLLFITSAFISGTISFISGSILQAEELSITMPYCAKAGANSFETFLPAENKTRSGLAASPSLILTI